MWSSFRSACTRAASLLDVGIVTPSKGRPRQMHNACIQQRRFPSVDMSSSVLLREAKVIFSGIQPTGIPHLGNYLGALLPWVQNQNKARAEDTLIYSLVDLHAITIQQNPTQLRKWKQQSLAILLAIGLTPDRSIMFHQSDVPAHTELMWVLSCLTSTGRLGRMTQWKQKTQDENENSEKLKLGLLSYPVLQAADVLLYRATHVPVGEDQAQHLEFARDLASAFNHLAGRKVLTLPETLISPAKRVMSLTDPSKKMSKSDANPKSRVLLTDTTDEIQAKVKTAVTDSIEGISYDPVARPGISNLIDILYYANTASEADRQDTKQDLVRDMESLSKKAFKSQVTSAIHKMLSPIREKYDHLLGTGVAEKIGHEGAAMANEIASSTLRDVKRAVGLT